MTVPADPLAAFAFRNGERETLAERIERHRDALARLIIAIDGPAGSGKSTTARAVARRLGLRHLDSGALYRALTLAATRAGIAVDDAAALARLAQESEIRVTSAPDGMRVWLAGEDVTDAVRAPEVTAAVSRTSAIPQVRAAMLQQQRELAATGGTVMDGRDIGSVVLPRADLKVFLTADVEARAARRQREEAERGRRRDRQTIAREIAARDQADSTRDVAPLVCAPDAVRLDTTALSIEAQVDAVVALALRRVEGGGAPATTLDPAQWAQPGYRAWRNGLYHLAHDVISPGSRFWFGLRRRIHPGASLRGSVLVACNHISGLDPPIVGGNLPFDIWFVAKSELFRNPLIGRILRAVNAYPIQRGTADYVALDHAVELLRGGQSVIMFPEGTRQVPGRLGRPRWGFGYVARHAGRPVVPVFVRGTRDRRPRGLRHEPMEVWAGEAYRFDPGAPDSQEGYLRIGEEAMERIAGLMLRSAAEHPLPGLELPGRWASRPMLTGP